MTTTPPGGRRRGPTLPGFRTPSDSKTVWFSAKGCVVWHAGGRRDVLVGGMCVGSFEAKDAASRNLLLVMLAREDVVLEDLAHAFGLSGEGLRLIRRAYEAGGYEAIVKRKRGRRGPWKVTTRLRKAVESCFSEGLSVSGTRKKLKNALSERTLTKLRKEWRQRQAEEHERASEPPAQKTLKLDPPAAAQEAPREPNSEATSPSQPTTGELESAPPETASEPQAPSTPACVSPEEPAVTGSITANPEAETKSSYVARTAEGEAADERLLPSAGPKSAKHVSYLGAWLLVALTARQGLHAAVLTEAAAKAKAMSASLRLAVDAVTMALAIGQGCVEGVRRLAHRSAAALLLATRAPSPAWVRKTLGLAAAEKHGFSIQARLSGELIRAATSTADVAVFYVDNHMRPYTGLRRLLRGWRMQDKRAKPGTTDCHVHDVDGRPLYRIATAMHDSLGKLLFPIGILLRLALGKGQRILLAFDRAASYADVMEELRDADFEFVAYEKKPYASLPKRAFTDSFELDGEIIRYVENRKNLGDERGRVRRICLLLPSGHQMNLLANSTLSAAALAAIMAGRWNQENAFKHAVERWGLNQLDGRSFPDMGGDVVIPSPLRRRLENSLAVLREAEGRLRRKLAQGPCNEDKAKMELDLSKNLAQQRRLEAKRPDLPTHCTVDEAGLTGVLKRHEDEYKAVIDTIRTASINAEADLATELADVMMRPREAKRLLQNVFTAPGEAKVREDRIDVILDVAGRPDEQRALHHLFRVASSWNLSLPGDPLGRPLRFRAKE